MTQEPIVVGIDLIEITYGMAVWLVVIGFVGGLLSGFIGIGGAFIMTPAMMSMGIPGMVAVAAIVTHKFGKAIMGAKKQSEMGNVDIKLGLVMFAGLLAGVRAAFDVNQFILEKAGLAGSNLYISLVLIIVLTGVSVIIVRDLAGGAGGKGQQGPAGGKVAGRLRKIQLPPVIFFKVSGISVSLLVVLPVGLATGYLAGTIGAGGFIGIPAMVYLLGANIRVAGGTQLFLAIFSGIQGAFLYLLNGYVDLRIPLLLYIGSLVGVTLGVIVSNKVKGRQIQEVMALITAMVVVSRVFTVPGYMAELGYLSIAPGWLEFFGLAGNVFLAGSGLAGSGLILWWMSRGLSDKGPGRPGHQLSG